MTRGFEVVKGRDPKDIRLPERSTKYSAGYDFFAPDDVTIEPIIYTLLANLKVLIQKDILGDDSVMQDTEKIVPTLIKTGVKAYMQGDEVLYLYNRSSNPKKLGLIIPNSVGVVDSDYYSNTDNDGEIGFMFYNIFPWPVKIKNGEKLGQGIFSKYLVVDNDIADGERSGGFGSTGK